MRCLNCNTDGLLLDTEICPSCNVHLPSLMRDILPGGKRLHSGKYEIDYALGRGGFGVTYRANHILLKELVAIKEYFPHSCAVRNPTTGGFSIPNNQREMFLRGKKRFLKEGKILAKLKHPHVVRVRDLFEENDTAYLVMELVDGKSLRSELQLQPGRRFSPERVKEIMGYLVGALAAVHQKGVFHLDLKPDNILLTPEGKLVLVDFGSAKQAVGTQMHSSSTFTFTQGYAAPEVIGGGKVGVESDIFELGMMVHELLVGELPPNALMRLMGSSWQPVGLGSPWQELLEAALALRKESRPKSIRQWWQIVSEGGENFSEMPAVGEGRSLPLPASPFETTVEKIVASQPLPLPASPLETTVAKSVVKKSVAQISLSTFEFETVTVDARGEITKRERRQAEMFVEDLGDGVELEMVSIPGGSFLMGSPKNEAGRSDSEGPQHEVKVPSFFMGKYPVTQKQYEAVTGDNPSHFKGANRPVEQVSWSDAVKFCRRLSEKTGRQYRLPSEAEWEYACRAGTTAPFYFGETITTDLVNYDGNYTYGSTSKGVYREETTEVGSFPPNAFGLYDMHGNVWEWCQDVWHQNYNGAPTDGSAWVFGGDNSWRLRRGGSWDGNPENCRCAGRNRVNAGSSNLRRGFRVVLVAASENNDAASVPSVEKSPPTADNRYAATVTKSAANLFPSTFEFETVTVDAQGEVTARERRQAEMFVEDLGDGVELEMVSIPGGSFTMGSPESEKGGDKSERPQHETKVPSFFMGKYPVTQQQYEAIMEDNPSYFKGSNRPVENLKWDDAAEFCRQLSQKTGRQYRLPSEAEWEYACRAGTTTPFYFGETITTDLVNYDGNYVYGSGPKGTSRKETKDVGSFPPNAFGLYDMHGNVWEWCQDVWHNNYNGAPTNEVAWESGGENSYRLLRGGSWSDNPKCCRSGNRYGYDAGIWSYYVGGFRVVLVAASENNDAASAPSVEKSPPKTDNLSVKSAANLSTFEFETVTVDAGGEITARERCQAEMFVEDLGEGVELEMVSIPGGSFLMGSPEDEERRNNDESPQHEVNVPPFFLGKYPGFHVGELTLKKWRSVKRRTTNDRKTKSTKRIRCRPWRQKSSSS